MYWFCHTSTWIRQCPDSASDAGDKFASTTPSAALLATPTDPHQGSFYRDPKRLRFGRSWLIPKTNDVPLNPVLASNRPSERRFGGGENTGFGTDIPGYYPLLSKEPQIKHYHLSGFHLTFKDVAGFRKNTYSCRMRVEVGSGCFFTVPDVSFCVETNSWPLSYPFPEKKKECFCGHPVLPLWLRQ